MAESFNEIVKMLEESKKLGKSKGVKVTITEIVFEVTDPNKNKRLKKEVTK